MQGKKPRLESGEAPESVHVWLVLTKALHAIAALARHRLQQAGLCESDFRVLEVLLHKGALPVNTIGPKVHLTTGSISTAVDRLHKKGLVSRVEGAADRRVRMVDLTPRGRTFITPVFRSHAAVMDEVFQELSPADRSQLEALLKKIGRRAERLSRAR